jgi:hypothetical protein
MSDYQRETFDEAIKQFNKMNKRFSKMIEPMRKIVKKLDKEEEFESDLLEYHQEVTEFKQLTGTLQLVNTGRNDLSRYQIYKKNDINQDFTYSLYYAAIMNGVDPNLLPNEVLSVADLATYIKHDILLYRIVGKNRSVPITYFCKKEERISTIKISIYKGHYFAYESSGCMNEVNPAYKKTRNFMSLAFIHKMFEEGYIEQIIKSVKVMAKSINLKLITPVNFAVITVVMQEIVIFKPIDFVVIQKKQPIVLETKVFEPIFKETSKYKMVTRTIVRPPLSVQDFSANRKMKYNKKYLDRLEYAAHYIIILKENYPELATRLEKDIVPYIGNEKYTTISVKVKKPNMKNEGRYNLLADYINPVIDEIPITSPNKILSLLDKATYKDSVFSFTAEKISEPRSSFKGKRNNGEYSKRYKSEVSMRNNCILTIADHYKECHMSNEFIDKILEFLERPLKPISEDDLKYQIRTTLKYDNQWIVFNKIIPNNLEGEINKKDITQKIYDIIQSEIYM